MDILFQKVFADIDQQRTNIDMFNKELLENLDKGNKDFWEGLGKTNEDVVHELQKMMGQLEESQRPTISFLQNIVAKPFNPFAA